MEELIKITEHEGKQAVSAKELYEKLGYDKSQWSRWYLKNIINNEFAIENQDWQGFDTVSNGNITKDFVLSLDFAKRIAMMSRTETGEAVRNYFILREKQYLALIKQPSQLSTLDLLELTVKEMRAQRTELDEIKSDVRQLKAATQARPEVYTAAGFLTIKGVPATIQTCVKIGKIATKLCKEKGWPIDTMPDPRFGKVNLYPTDALNMAYCAVQF